MPVVAYKINKSDASLLYYHFSFALKFWKHIKEQQTKNLSDFI